MFRKFTFSLLVALLFVAVASVAMAAEGAPAAGGDSNVKAVIALAAGFGIAIAAFLLTQTFYTVDPTKQVLVRQFGD